MSFSNSLYTLIIGPLELLFEFVFTIANRFVYNPGFSIIILSITVNLLVLPLYRRADLMQAEQRKTENELKKWVDHINKSFQGDERFMILHTYYRQKHYKPVYVIKSSISILLEIPFFIAAYNFLSGLKLLSGVSFGPIVNLGAPDRMITSFGFSINILPVLMTIINILSASIYLSGFPIKDKLRTYGIALVFLIFLYDSPSGLVLYWLLNNVFSLIKNVVLKSNHPRGIITNLTFLIGLLFLLYAVFFFPFANARKKIFLICIGIVLIFPKIFRFIGGIKYSFPQVNSEKNNDLLFFSGAVFLAIFTGVYIPSGVISAAPMDFINQMKLYSPLWYVLKTLLLSTGTFLIWFSIFYKLSSSAIKNNIALFMCLLSFCSSVNFMFFGTKRGTMSSELVFEIFPYDTKKEILLNFIVLFLICVILSLIFSKRKKIINIALISFCGAVVVMSFMNVQRIRNDSKILFNYLQQQDNRIPKITLSKNGKNVIIVMMDRAIGYYVPFLFAERPELIQKFSGFTYYPQTLSFASATIGALPPLYGGYDYTPDKTNKRSELSLVSKHNEALRMLPVIFDEAGFEVSVVQPSYANYLTPSDLSIYSDHPNINAYNLQQYFGSIEVYENEINTRNRNFFCYSLYKISPLIIQPTIYSSGSYNKADVSSEIITETMPYQVFDGLLKAYGTKGTFLEEYTILSNLSIITNITNEEHNTFITFDNGTTHEPTLLQMPDYKPSSNVDNSDYDFIPMIRKSIDGREISFNSSLQTTHYHVNMAAFLQLGQWMDYLREHNVYDNTRIIIVSDHGFTQLRDDFIFCDKTDTNDSQYKMDHDILWFNPVLLVKDFYSDGFTTNEQFMTNADVPEIAMAGLIDLPINPSTGQPVFRSEYEKNNLRHIVYKVEEGVEQNTGNVFLPSSWYVYHGNDIYDPNNWEVLGVY